MSELVGSWSVLSKLVGSWSVLSKLVGSWSVLSKLVGSWSVVSMFMGSWSHKLVTRVVSVLAERVLHFLGGWGMYSLSASLFN
jgi:hypothetical protein